MVRPENWHDPGNDGGSWDQRGRTTPGGLSFTLTDPVRKWTTTGGATQGQPLGRLPVSWQVLIGERFALRFEFVTSAESAGACVRYRPKATWWCDPARLTRASSSEFTMDHRGRFQAQGRGLEESEPWDEEEPLRALQAHHLLDGLRLRIPPREAAHRQEPFWKAHRFIDSAATSGGVGFCKKSYVARGSRDRRVDIEVQSGLAFV